MCGSDLHMYDGRAGAHLAWSHASGAMNRWAWSKCRRGDKQAAPLCDKGEVEEAYRKFDQRKDGYVKVILKAPDPALPAIMFSTCWPLTTCWTLDIFARGNLYGLSGATRDLRQAPPAPAWGPLRHPVFRALWIASVAANVGTWMQNVGAAWLMTSLTPSPTLVALVQTATSLPFLVAALPAGALADIVDRRKLLMAAQGWMFLVALVLAVLTWMGAMTPALLLVLTFALGLGLAVNLPTWQSISPTSCPGRAAPGDSLGGVNINLSRAIGPAIGGFVIAATGPAATFLINAASFLFALFVFSRWQGSPLDTELTERLPGAVRAGLRYVRNEPALRAVLVRAGLFMVGGSAILALLPLVARQELGLGSEGYGLLLGCFGAGAVIGAALLPRFKQMASPNLLVGAASVVLAATTASPSARPEPVRDWDCPAGRRCGVALHDG